MNTSGNNEDNSANSVPQYEIVAYDGTIFGPFGSRDAARKFAQKRWPDQEQDDERTGKGWDVQMVGVDD